MDEQPGVTQEDLRGAWTRCNTLPARYEIPGDEVRVQWAARKAIEALTRLNIEILIAEERRQIGINERQAKGRRSTLRGLTKLRVKRDNAR
ncbi:Uncharacterised protein [Mycobacteroides abscessus subsp. bolletii]|uniref:hypothetical protein n=1 Tax=Mycobacteroides abscessus TaxID=36809 RepID=UPI0009A8893F|nr:hypothetical protein [Mycobacteroides abscessus]SKX81102.1 Uncharacterised protein [Mycobacteroides abscessus subsp. bolletii]